MKDTKSLLVCILCAAAAANLSAANPFITDRWTADPAPLVDGDTLYLFTSHDEAKDGELLDYASAPSPEGPWTYRGRLTGGACGSYTIHPGLCRFKGRDILFYHNASLAIDGVGGAAGTATSAMPSRFTAPANARKW